MKAVTPDRISIARRTLKNADIAAVACREAGLPFYVACALLEKESGGRNVYGHDSGGALAGFPGEVNKANFEVFLWLVRDKGQPSNGVGPCQITYKGYLDQMIAQGLKPYDVHDNMLFGFRLLASSHAHLGQWAAAFATYNGGPTPNRAALDYGTDGKKKADAWRKLLGI